MSIIIPNSDNIFTVTWKKIPKQQLVDKPFEKKVISGIHRMIALIPNNETKNCLRQLRNSLTHHVSKTRKECYEKGYGYLLRIKQEIYISNHSWHSKICILISC